MKRTALLFTVLILTLFLVACGAEKTEPFSDTSKVDSFSWSETVGFYEGKDDAGIKRDGFVNTSASKIENSDDALRLAQNEHILQSDEAYSVSYDKETDTWEVSFFPKDNNVLGGCVDVYLNHEGITQLIVAGE